MRLSDRTTGLLLCIFLSVILTLNSCSERERSPVGFSQYPDSLLLSPDTLTLDSILADSTYHHFVPTGSSPILLLGFADSCEAWALFRFEHGFSDYDSSKIHLSLVEPLDSSLEFGIHQVSADWNDTLVVWPFHDYNPAPLLQCSFSEGETLLVVDCPAPETTIDAEDTTLIWNLLLLPTSGGLARINGKESQTDPLIFTYQDSTPTYIHPQADAYVIDYLHDPDLSLLWVGAGWVLRSDLKFDISALPSNSIINRAELILQVSGHSTGWMDIIALISETGESGTGYLNSDSTSITIPVTDLLQYWVNSENTGMTIKTSDETAEVSRVSFYSSDSTDKRPIIRVMYTEGVYEE